MATKKNDVHVGCCGFRRSRSDYFKKYSLVEVQHTFYEPPSIPLLEKWRSEAPKDFEFVIKAWQLITHEGTSPTYKRLKRELTEEEKMTCGYFRPTEIVKEALDVTLASAAALRASWIIFQCPARFKPSDENIENMRIFFQHERPSDIRYGWEPRGAWPQPLIQTLCEELELIHVVDPFVTEPVTSNPYYFRIHGKRGRGFRFSDSDLMELVETVSANEKSYVLFNHLAMLEDSVLFMEKINGQVKS